MKWSKLQQDIFEHISSTNDSMLIEATAGSGKTTTLVECANLLPPSQSKQFLAFNKSIAEELKTKLPASVNCKTFHSSGMQLLYRAGVKIKRVNQYKIANFIKREFEGSVKELLGKDESFTMACYVIADLIGMHFKHSPFETSPDSLIKTCNIYSLAASINQCKLASRIITSLDSFNADCINTGKEMEIDFDDMLRLPIKHDLFFGNQKDILFVDECQDMSNLQIKFIHNLVKPNGRIIAVGDRFQSIYLFAGASESSFDTFSKMVQSNKPLSISYRCPEKVVKEAKSICPSIESFGNREGEVIVSRDTTKIQPKDLVVSRNTIPLIHLYFDLLKQNKNSKIRGKDFEKSITKFITKKTKKIDDVREGMEKDLDNYKLKLKERGVKKPENTKGYSDRQAARTALEIIVRERKVRGIRTLINALNEIFDDRNQDNVVELMTIHRAKGLEADNVFMIDTFANKPLIPSEWAKTHAELRQERNLLFVAITRAKNRFTYLKM